MLIFTYCKFFKCDFYCGRYAGAVYACCRYVSVRPSVCLLHTGIVTKQLNVESRKQRHTIAHGLQFADTKDFCEIPTESPQQGRQIDVW